MAWSVFQVYSMTVDRQSYGLVCVPSLQYGSGQAMLWPGLCSKSTVWQWTGKVMAWSVHILHASTAEYILWWCRLINNDIGPVNLVTQIDWWEDMQTENIG